MPQQIVAEGEACEEDVADDVPALETHRLALYPLQDGKHVLRGREGSVRKPAHIQVKLLIEELEQGAVHPEVVEVDVDGIDGRGKTLAVDCDGIEEEGSVFLLALLLLLPFEEARGEIEGEGARLLLYGALLAEEAEEGGVVLALVEDGAQPAVAVFIENIVREGFQKSAAVEPVGELVQALEVLLGLALEGVGADLRHVLRV